MTEDITDCNIPVISALSSTGAFLVLKASESLVLQPTLRTPKGLDDSLTKHGDLHDVMCRLGAEVQVVEVFPTALLR